MYPHNITCLRGAVGTRVLGKPNITGCPFSNSSTATILKNTTESCTRPIYVYSMNITFENSSKRQINTFN